MRIGVRCRVRRGVLVALVAAGPAAGCAATDTAGAAANGRLRVVATTTQVADFARVIGGRRVAVHQILKPNVDPHDYRSSPADVQAIADADLVVENGVGLERWLHRDITAAGFSGNLVDTSTGVPIRRGNGTAEEAAGDPHIWQDPHNAAIMAANIERAYAAADHRDARYFARNLKRYRAKLTALDHWIARRIATIPPKHRELVTNHDAFGYYLARYHLRYVGSVIPSFDTSAQLSARGIADLVAKIKRTGTPAVFSETSLQPKAATAIARQAGVRVEAGPDSLYGDTLGPAGSPGATYLGMERHNTNVIVSALTGKGGPS